MSCCKKNLFIPTIVVFGSSATIPIGTSSFINKGYLCHSEKCHETFFPNIQAFIPQRTGRIPIGALIIINAGASFPNIPANARSVKFQLVGGGGGGGSGGVNGGSGPGGGAGGGAGFLSDMFPISPTTAVTIVVGGGGGRGFGADGLAGNSTILTFNGSTTFTANGGVGGFSVAAGHINPAGGNGGSSSSPLDFATGGLGGPTLGDDGMSGEVTTSGTSVLNGGGGGGAGGAIGKSGGNGASTGTHLGGLPGNTTATGGGGGGGGASFLGVGGNGGTGNGLSPISGFGGGGGGGGGDVGNGGGGADGVAIVQFFT